MKLINARRLSAVLYVGQIPWSITGLGLGDGWFPARTTSDPDVVDALADGSLAIRSHRYASEEHDDDPDASVAEATS